MAGFKVITEVWEFYCVLIPEFGNYFEIPAWVFEDGRNSAMQLRNLVPGRYRVYFVRDPKFPQYLSPEAIERQLGPGQEVTIAAGATAEVSVTLPPRQ